MPRATELCDVPVRGAEGRLIVAAVPSSGSPSIWLMTAKASPLCRGGVRRCLDLGPDVGLRRLGRGRRGEAAAQR